MNEVLLKDIPVKCCFECPDLRRRKSDSFHDADAKTTEVSSDNGGSKGWESLR